MSHEKQIKKENIHKGHRQRVKDNFLNAGLEGFQYHEILELLLFFGIPQKDTNVIAHELMNTFGSFNAVFDAKYTDLVKVKGMTANAAVLITLVPRIMRALGKDSVDAKPLTDIDTICDYFVKLYYGVRNEEIKLCCLDNEMKVKYCTTLCEGGIEDVKIDMRKLIETIFSVNSNYVIIAHNHPNAFPTPSPADLTTTKLVRDTLELLKITLVDHVIVGKNIALSLKDSGYFECL